MARPKKTLDPDKALAQAVSKMGELDPKFLIIVSAAGIAGLNGQMGPLSSIVSGFGGEPGSKLTQEKISEQSFAWAMAPGTSFIQWLFAPPEDKTGPDSGIYAQRVGMAAANVVEAALLYQLVSNPEVFKALLDVSKSAATGAVGLIKALPAIV